MVVTSAPTSTTNITGFLTIVRGFNFRNESRMAVRRIFPSPRDIALCCACSGMAASENLSSKHHQVLKNRAKTERRKKCKRAHNQNRGNEQRAEQRACYGKRSDGLRGDFFLRQ